MSLNKEIILRAVDVPFHRSFRALGHPVIAPLEITFAVTYRCLNLCHTCNSFQHSRMTEMSDKDYSAIFQDMPFTPFSIVFTGGEPFLRGDFGKIIGLACKELEPPLVQIQSCGDQPDTIADTMRQLPDYYKNIQFVVWLSMDGTHSDLEQMRGGVPHSFESLLKSYKMLRSISAPNMLVGLNLLISKFNEDKGLRLVDDAFSLYPDMVSLDIAFGSEVLGVTAVQVMPDIEKVDAIVSSYTTRLRRMRGRSAVRLFRRLLAGRVRMAQHNIRYMTRMHSCFAGHASLYIDPAGSVKDCPVAARELGDLKENAFSLDRILKAETANRVRDQVKNSDCFCTMAATSLSNFFLSPRGYLQLAAASL